MTNSVFCRTRWPSQQSLALSELDGSGGLCPPGQWARLCCEFPDTPEMPLLTFLLTFQLVIIKGAHMFRTRGGHPLVPSPRPPLPAPRRAAGLQTCGDRELARPARPCGNRGLQESGCSSPSPDLARRPHALVSTCLLDISQRIPCSRPTRSVGLPVPRRPSPA